MQNQNVLITGGASGLGLGCAQRFVRLGAQVTLADINEKTARDAIAKLQSLAPGARLRFEPVDLARPDSIQRMAKRLIDAGRPLDVLVNNAGIYPPAQCTLSEEGHELTFAIAHLGHFRLTHALWPLLQAARTARVIGVTSMVQRKAALDISDLSVRDAYLPIKAYQQAKLSCLLFSLELQRRLDVIGGPIRSYAAHPGVCRTQLAGNRRQLATDSRWQRLKSRAMSWGMSHFGQSPENGAASIIEAAVTTTLPGGSFIGPSGWLEIAGPPRAITPGKSALDRDLARALWQKTEQLTGISWMDE